MDKRACQRLHAKKRARQRYGINLNSALNRAIIKGIQGGEYRVLAGISNTRSVFEVCIENRYIAIVYDNVRKNVVTFLPVGWWEQTDDWKFVNAAALAAHIEHVGNTSKEER